MDERAADQAGDGEEFERLRATLEHRTDQWREVLRLLAAAESRCIALEESLLQHVCEPRLPETPADIGSLGTGGVDWDRLHRPQVLWPAD